MKVIPCLMSLLIFGVVTPDLAFRALTESIPISSARMYTMLGAVFFFRAALVAPTAGSSPIPSMNPHVRLRKSLRLEFILSSFQEMSPLSVVFSAIPLAGVFFINQFIDGFFDI